MSYRNKRPLIVFGTAEDLSTWVQWSGTGTASGSQTDPWGGTDAYLLADTDATAITAFVMPSSVTMTLNSDGSLLAVVALKNSDATNSDVGLYDNNTSGSAGRVRVTWSGATLTGVAVQGGSATILPTIDLGSGWYLVRVLFTGLTSGHSFRGMIYPASSGVASTSSIYAWAGSVLTLFADEMNAWSDPREGSETVRGTSGAMDAWTLGDDYRLSGKARWIPPIDVGNPENLSGWEGERETPMLGVGWDSFLRFARDAQSFIWVPDQSVGSVNYNALLEKPKKGEPPLEDDMTRSVEFTFLNADGVPFLGY